MRMSKIFQCENVCVVKKVESGRCVSSVRKWRNVKDGEEGSEGGGRPLLIASQCKHC